MRLAAERAAAALVLSGFAAGELAGMVFAARVELPRTHVVALVRGRCSRRDEERLIACGAAAVARYPLPDAAQRQLAEILSRHDPARVPSQALGPPGIR